MATGIKSWFDFGGDNKQDDLADALNNLYKQQAEKGLSWMNYYQPQMESLNNALMPVLTQSLQNGGLPQELDESIWRNAQLRSAQGYDKLGDQLGSIMASRGTLNSGPALNAWMDKVGLAQAQDTSTMATEQAKTNYDYLQNAVKNAQTSLGLQPQSSYSTMNYSQDSNDYSGWGSLIAKIMAGAFPGSKKEQIR